MSRHSNYSEMCQHSLLKVTIKQPCFKAQLRSKVSLILGVGLQSALQGLSAGFPLMSKRTKEKFPHFAIPSWAGLVMVGIAPLRSILGSFLAH